MSKEISANSHLISRLPVETTIDMFSKAKHPNINYIDFERLTLKPIWIPIEKSEFCFKNWLHGNNQVWKVVSKIKVIELRGDG